jgi:uncharacterized protein
MSNDLHALSTPAFLHGLSILTSLLRKAEQHATDRKIASSALLTARLFPDMFPLIGQVQSACDTAKRGVARLIAVEPPRYDDDETTFEQLYARIQKTLEFIAKHHAEAFLGAGERKVEMKMSGGVIALTGLEYLTRFALPNFYFHLTTAYNILRHNGVVLGKSDFLGSLRRSDETLPTAIWPATTAPEGRSNGGAPSDPAR